MAQPLVQQKLPQAALITFLAVLSAAGPLATDIFMPAIPSMPAELNTTEAIVNLNISLFFLTQGIGMLVFGPISDRYGRKKPLAVTLVLSCGCAAAAAFAPNIWFLLCMRIFQGFGGGGMIAIATALVKDCFEGESRRTALVVVQAISCVAPIVAPLLGSAILNFVDWRGTFAAQAIITALCIPFAVALVEPLPEEMRTTGNPLLSLRGLIVVAKNGTFTKLLVTMTASSLGIMAYVTGASYIYMDFFGLSTLGYSLFFGGNSLISVIGTLCVITLAKHLGNRRFINLFATVTPLGSLLILLIGGLSPWTFLLAVAITNTSCGMLRPVVADILLGLQQKDTGSAAGLINFVCSMYGCLGSLLVSLPWPNYIVGVGTIYFVFSLITLGGWVLMKKYVPAE